MFYTVYKISNQIDGKFYIGTHKTENLNDTYMGSGKYLNRAIEKYGVENFKKEILFVYDTPEPMFAKEEELVNEDFLATENTYNLKIGGFGGWDFNNSKEGQLLREHSYQKWSKAGTAKFLELLQTDETFSKARNEHMKIISKRGLRRISELFPNGTFLGRNHNENTKEKMRESAKGKHDGNKNSQFGTMWITNGTENKKIKKTPSIPEGWKRGRS